MTPVTYIILTDLTVARQATQYACLHMYFIFCICLQDIHKYIVNIYKKTYVYQLETALHVSGYLNIKPMCLNILLLLSK